MTDIEIVIKLPENIVEDAKSSPNYYPTYHFEEIWKAIVNGKQLPKGHGDLIDADEFRHTLEDMPIRDTDKWFNWLQKACIRLAEAPTIVEADKEVKE